MFKRSSTMSKSFVVVILLTILTANASTLHKHHEVIFEGRIVGGEATTIEQVPYQISLHKNGRHSCGGSIISKEWVLTAAHCVENIIINDLDVFSIRAGSTEHNAGGTNHTIAEIVRHENYGLDIWRHLTDDIALVRVEQYFEMDKTRQAIELFDRGEESLENVESVVTGWGDTGNKQKALPTILRLVRLPIIKKEDCFNYYGSYGGIPEREICAGYPEGGKDACVGDSGGPLVIDGRLAGITSWGHGCAKPRQPGVYTEIAAHRSWIKTHSGI